MHGVKMNSVKLQWATSSIDSQILYQARVSNPKNQNSTDTHLLKYCMKHGHVSPFEMANVCFEITTTRDISRQLLRHKSFSFQEFSQRYQTVSELPNIPFRRCRLQDLKNRQNSIETNDPILIEWWESIQHNLFTFARAQYDLAIQKGVAKEQARALLPEGLTTSRLYMNGNMRSWIHYLQQRLDKSTQEEHRELALLVLANLREVAPLTMEAFFEGEGDA